MFRGDDTYDYKLEPDVLAECVLCECFDGTERLGDGSIKPCECACHGDEETEAALAADNANDQEWDSVA